MNEHGQYDILISQLLDGELPDNQAAELKAHIRACPQCRETYRALSLLSQAVRDDLAEPPAALRDSVMRRVTREEAPSQRTPPRARHARRPLLGLAAAACLVLIAGGALFILRFRAGSDSGAAAYDTAEVYGIAENAGEESAEVEEAAEDSALYADEAETESAQVAAASAAGTAEEADTQADSSEGYLSVYGPDGEYLGAIAPENQDAFTALLDDAGAAASAQDDGTAQSEELCTVEYHGVIYAFSTDDGQRLYWRDAAEGYPTLSTSTADDLWALVQ